MYHNIFLEVYKYIRKHFLNEFSSLSLFKKWRPKGEYDPIEYYRGWLAKVKAMHDEMSNMVKNKWNIVRDEVQVKKKDDGVEWWNEDVIHLRLWTVIDR